jgi:hypothetical protein
MQQQRPRLRLMLIRTRLTMTLLLQQLFCLAVDLLQRNLLSCLYMTLLILLLVQVQFLSLHPKIQQRLW